MLSHSGPAITWFIKAEKIEERLKEGVLLSHEEIMHAVWLPNGNELAVHRNMWREETLQLNGKFQCGMSIYE